VEELITAAVGDNSVVSRAGEASLGAVGLVGMHQQLSLIYVGFLEACDLHRYNYIYYKFIRGTLCKS
jgi:hypothetical protein